MKLAITGASGFIGSHLVKRLLTAQPELEIFALQYNDRWIGPHHPRLHTIAGDIREPESLGAWLKGADYIIHAAGLLGKAGVPTLTYLHINVDGARHVLQAAAKYAPNAKILHLSSAGVLGPIPKEEAGKDGVWPDETAPFAPSTPYEESKVAAEWLVERFVAEGLQVTIARPEFVYGPGDLHVLGLFQMIQRGLFFYVGDGLNTCHPTYIDDTVDGLLGCLWHGRVGEAYHITGPRPLTFRELASTIAHELQVPPPRLALPVPLVKTGAILGELLGRPLGRTPPLSRTGVAFFSEYRGSTYAKAQAELGYQPRVDLAEGIKETVAWYRAQGHLA
jgi:nucleoside-diphosphate-sugar epimerase